MTVVILASSGFRLLSHVNLTIICDFPWEKGHSTLISEAELLV